MPAWAAALGTGAALRRRGGGRARRSPMPDDPIDPLEGARYALEGRVSRWTRRHRPDDGAGCTSTEAASPTVRPPARARPDGFDDAPVVRHGRHDLPRPDRAAQPPELQRHPAVAGAGHVHEPRPVGGPRRLPRRRHRADVDPRPHEPATSRPSSATSRPSASSAAPRRRRASRSAPTPGILQALPGHRAQRRADRRLDLPDAATHIADVDHRHGRGVPRPSSNRRATLLLHLSEGIDASARRHFDALRITPRRWAITPALAGIHCAGLNDDRLPAARRATAAPWCGRRSATCCSTARPPTSLRPARPASLIALGSDWSPSGSKNLLAELKVATLVNEAPARRRAVHPSRAGGDGHDEPGPHPEVGRRHRFDRGGQAGRLPVLDDTVATPTTASSSARETAMLDGGDQRCATLRVAGAPVASSARDRARLYGRQRRPQPCSSPTPRATTSSVRSPSRRRAIGSSTACTGCPELGRRPRGRRPAEGHGPCRRPVGARARPEPPVATSPAPSDRRQPAAAVAGADAAGSRSLLVADDDKFLDRVVGQRNLGDALKKELAAFYA